MNISRYCDQIIFVALVFLNIALTLFFDIRLYSVFDLSKVGILLLVSLVTMTLWLIKIVCTGEFKFPYTPLNIPILSYIVIAVVATIFSISPFMSLTGGYKRFEGLIEISSYVFLFYAFLVFINSNKKLNIVLNAIVGTSVSTAVYAFMQYFGKDPFRWSSENPDRLFSTFGNPVFFSAMLITTLPLSLALYLGYQTKNKIDSNNGDKSAKNNRLVKDIIYGMCTLVIYTVFWHTKTRADFVGLMVLLPVFFVLLGKDRRRANKWKIIIMVTIFVIIGALYNMQQSSSVFHYWAGEIGDKNIDLTEKKETVDNNVTVDNTVVKKVVNKEEINDMSRYLSGSSLNRYYQYKTAVKVFNDYPFLGIGPDTLGIVYQKYLGETFIRKKAHTIQWPRHDRVHNDVLENVVARGGIGLVTYIWVVLAYFWLVSKYLFKKRDKAVKAGEANSFYDKFINAGNEITVDKKLIVIGLGSGVLGYIIQNEFSFGNTPIITLFWSLIALTMLVIYSPRFLLNKATQIKTSLTNRKPRFQIVKVAGSVLVLTVMVFLSTQVFSWYKADTLMESGRRHCGASDFENGLKFYSESVLRNPFEVNYRDMLNNSLFQVAVKTNKIEWLLNIINVANANLKIIPDHYLGFYALGNAYYLLSQNHGKDTLDLAIENYKKAIESDPFQAEFYHHLAICYIAKKNLDEAAKALETAIVHKNTSLVYLDKLFRIYLQLNNVDALDKVYNEMFPNCGTNASFSFVKGVYLTKKERHEEAVKEFKKSLEYDPNNLECVRNIIIVSSVLGKNDDVIKYLEKAVKLRPDDIQYHVKLGERYAKSGLLKKAVTEYHEIIKLDPTKEKEYLNVIANVYLALKDLENAELFFKKSIEIDPANAELYNSLGSTYAQKQMHDNALSMIQKASSMNPNNVTFLANIAKIYYVQGKMENTTNVLKQILQMDPNNNEAKNLLAKIK